MSSPSQRLVQSYLERHGIGTLFEDMMAKLIKEMPNEPVAYLLLFLQKVNLNQRNVPQNTFPSSILYKQGMELTGSSIPLKYSSDPQIVLPGSRPTRSSWMESSAKDSISGEHDVNKSRSYEKPWLVGSKQAKGIGEKKSEPPSWITDTKAKSIDDLFEQVDEKNTKLPLKEQLKIKKVKEKKWSDEPPVDEKENNVPHNTSSAVLLLQYNPLNSEKADSFSDELKIESPRHVHDSKKKICSPQTYSKFKRTIAKKKSFERKEKLQALLSTGSIASVESRSKEDNCDSTDNEADNIIEDSNELSLEGARSTMTGGLKHTYHKPSTDIIKVSVCSRCAKVVTGDSNLKQVSNNVTSMLSDSEEFASVSQVDQEKSYKPAWAAISNSETEDVINRTGKLKMPNSPKKGVLKNKSNIIQSSIEEDKSDFFEKNNPLRSKANRFVGNFISDNESDFTEVVKAMPKKAWQQRFDTGSDADVEDAEMEIKGVGWKQKVAISDINSDI